MDCLKFVVVFKGSVADYGWDELDTESMSNFALDVSRKWDALSNSVGEYIKGRLLLSIKTEVVARNRKEYIQTYIVNFNFDTNESSQYVQNIFKEVENLKEKGDTFESALAFVLSDICNKYQENNPFIKKNNKVKIVSVHSLYQYLCGVLERDSEQGKL